MEIIKSSRGGSKLCNNGYCYFVLSVLSFYYNNSKIFYILIAIGLIWFQSFIKIVILANEF